MKGIVLVVAALASIAGLLVLVIVLAFAHPLLLLPLAVTAIWPVIEAARQGSHRRGQIAYLSDRTFLDHPWTGH